MLMNSCGDFGEFQYNQNYPKQVGVGMVLDSYQKMHDNINVRIEEIPKQNKEVRKMATKIKRGLFQVILINPKEGKVIFNEYVICSKPEDVLLEANAGDVIKKAGLAVSEVDKIVNLLGEVRNVKKNKDGIVELVNEDSQE